MFGQNNRRPPQPPAQAARRFGFYSYERMSHSQFQATALQASSNCGNPQNISYHQQPTPQEQLFSQQLGHQILQYNTWHPGGLASVRLGHQVPRNCSQPLSRHPGPVNVLQHTAQHGPPETQTNRGQKRSWTASEVSNTIPQLDQSYYVAGNQGFGGAQGMVDNLTSTSAYPSWSSVTGGMPGQLNNFVLNTPAFGAPTAMNPGGTHFRPAKFSKHRGDTLRVSVSGRSRSYGFENIFPMIDSVLSPSGSGLDNVFNEANVSGGPSGSGFEHISHDTNSLLGSYRDGFENTSQETNSVWNSSGINSGDTSFETESVWDSPERSSRDRSYQIDSVQHSSPLLKSCLGGKGKKIVCRVTFKDGDQLATNIQTGKPEFPGGGRGVETCRIPKEEQVEDEILEPSPEAMALYQGDQRQNLSLFQQWDPAIERANELALRNAHKYGTAAIQRGAMDFRLFLTSRQTNLVYDILKKHGVFDPRGIRIGSYHGVELQHTSRGFWTIKEYATFQYLFGKGRYFPEWAFESPETSWSASPPVKPKPMKDDRLEWREFGYGLIDVSLPCEEESGDEESNDEEPTEHGHFGDEPTGEESGREESHDEESTEYEYTGDESTDEETDIE